MGRGPIPFLDSYQHMTMGIDKVLESSKNFLYRSSTSLKRGTNNLLIIIRKNAERIFILYLTSKILAKNMAAVGEYHNLYFECDVLLLADVFMNYTVMCLKLLQTLLPKKNYVVHYRAIHEVWIKIYKNP